MHFYWFSLIISNYMVIAPENYIIIYIFISKYINLLVLSIYFAILSIIPLNTICLNNQDCSCVGGFNFGSIQTLILGKILLTNNKNIIIIIII